MSKDTYYFPHDYNARTDEKIKRLFRVHGILGYGIFWAIVEDLYNNANAMRLDYGGIAFDLRTETDTVKSIINDFDLFVIEDDGFGSRSIERRLNERNEKSAKARKSASYRIYGNKKDANAMQTQCEGNAIKERKEKKESNTSKFPFESFWNIYDKKVDKNKVRAKWEKLSEADRQSALAYIPKYKEAQPDKNFRKNPETFLNNRSWENELIPSVKPNGKTNPTTSITNPAAAMAALNAGVFQTATQ